jgi:SagB-type dehydrogenase family enzyme
MLTLSACLFAPGLRAQSAAAQPLNRVSIEQLRLMLKGHGGDWRGDTDQAKGLPAPPVQKAVPKGGVVVDLVSPGSWVLEGAAMEQVMQARRSLRSYSDEGLNLKELSFLLWHTQGVTHAIRDKAGAVLEHFRATPSGGARHPFETYLAIQRVAGLEAGIYRYLPLEHKLYRVRVSDALPRELSRACYGQSFVGEAPVTFIWAAVPYRTEWKYGYIAHRMIAMEAGHICQNLYLAATAIGGGTCAVLGYHQAGMDALIGVDGKEEFVMYMAPVGKVKTK